MKKFSWRYMLCGAAAAGMAFPGVSSAVQINDLIVVAANDTIPSDYSKLIASNYVSPSAYTKIAAANTPNPKDNENIPMGQSSEQPSLLPEESGATDDDIFGIEGGYFHPYLNIYGEFTDNLFNSNIDETDNILTRISPGLWFALPRKKVIPISLAPHNTSPGGLQNQLEDRVSQDRFVSYGLLGADFKFYSEDSDLNDTDFIGEGLFRYNFRGGLSLQVIDRFTDSEDKFGTETITRESVRPRFNSNFFMATADWDMTEKLRFKFDYSNFYLSYDEDIDDFQDRTDNGADLYGYYRFSEKTSFFLQYRFVDVEYEDIIENDNQQDYYYGGITWNTTEKLALLFKAGFQQKEFDSASRSDFDGLALDAQATYRYSEKTEMRLSIYRTNEETDSFLASDKTVLGARLNYNQKFTEKITGTFDFQFEDADYSQLVVQERDEQTFYLRPAVQYLFKEWLQAELAYSYEEVISSEDFFEYSTNTFILGLNVAL